MRYSNRPVLWRPLSFVRQQVTLYQDCSSIYGPNEDSPDVFRNIANHKAEIGNGTCILCGDFNVIQDQNLDSFNYLHVNNPRAKECILSIKEEFNLVDTFRELYEFERKYT